MTGWTVQTNLNAPAWEKVHDPLQLELLELTGTLEQLGLTGGLSQAMPWGSPVVFVKFTDSPGGISTDEGLQEVLPTASIVGGAAELGTTDVAKSVIPRSAAIESLRFTRRLTLLR
jgi:hypothetical protein